MMRWMTCRRPVIAANDQVIEQPCPETGATILLVQRIWSGRSRAAVAAGGLTGPQLELSFRQYRVHHRGTRREWWETMARPSKRRPCSQDLQRRE